ncbi:MAG: SGNH/GDSL hydrolase family protein [Chloroflexi bacterium]|nr:SGNH/GDSL hydrolase family protein [Chloroflexota bacterium]
MDRWLVRIARLVGAATGALAGIVAVQLMRLRRMEFLPGHPGFYINHVVHPTGVTGRGGPLRLVVLGDSTTAGVGVDRAEHALPYLLAQRIADREQAPVHVVSYGWSGARVTDLLRIQLPRALEPLRDREKEPFLPGAHAVAVVIGSNDATHQTAPSRFRADLRATMDGIRAAAPHARIVLAGIPAFRGALRGVEPLIFIADQYARLLRRVARAEADRAGVHYADLARHVPPLIQGKTDVLSTDRFHPSLVGYSAWADVIFEALSGPGDGGQRRVGPMEPAGA